MSDEKKANNNQPVKPSAAGTAAKDIYGGTAKPGGYQGNKGGGGAGGRERGRDFADADCGAAATVRPARRTGNEDQHRVLCRCGGCVREGGTGIGGDNGRGQRLGFAILFALAKEPL